MFCLQLAASLLVLVIVSADEDVLVCGKAPPSFRIFAGYKVRHCELPWGVHITNKATNKTCTGSIIDAQHILTAAHCVSSSGAAASVDQIAVLGGDPFRDNATSFSLSSVAVHPKFASNPRADVAVITLSDALKFGECFYPVCLPEEGSTPLPNQWCTVFGWGEKEDGNVPATLHYQWDFPKTGDICDAVYKNATENGAFCGNVKQMVCRGDAGGPLACERYAKARYYQHGIVSTVSDSCFTQVALYTSVTHYLAWIKQQL